MQNLHYDSKDSEPRLKIDVRVEFRLGSGCVTQQARLVCWGYTPINFSGWVPELNLFFGIGSQKCT